MSRTSSRKPAAHASPNRLRIVGGRWRGVQIDFPPVEAIRPTPDRVRETLFNWLQQRVVGSTCLDLFAGSGALGIEALSRGASHTSFVERDARAAKHLQLTLTRLQANNAQVVCNDALTYLAQRLPDAPRFDIVFLDPPFAAELLPAVFGQLAARVTPEAFIYVECSAHAPLPSLPPGWSVYRSKRAGEVGYHLLQTRGAAVEES